MNIIRILAYLIQRGLSDIILHKYVQFFTYIATTVIVFICGLTLSLITTVDTELQQVKEEIVFHIYWKQNSPIEEIEQQWHIIDGMPYVQRKETFTPEQAFATLEKNIIPPQILTKEKQNSILPPTASVYFSVRTISNIPQWIKQTKEQLLSLPHVDRVANSPFKDRFITMWNHLHRYVIIPITILLFFSLALVIGNTLALCLQIRKQEVEILHCVGAPNWYIIAPLSTVSILQGLCGSLTALALLKLTIYYFRDILLVPPIMIELQFPKPLFIALLIFIPPIIGFIGTWFAVRIKTNQS